MDPIDTASQPQSAAEHTARCPQDRCVWMTGGVLSYWLCQWEYACDNCLLDAILSGRRPSMLACTDKQWPQGDVLHGIELPAIGRLGPPLRRRRGLNYHTAHVWAREITPGYIRVGLDDIAARLASGCDGWSLPTVGALLSRSALLGQTRNEGIEITVSSPLKGHVVSRNEALRRHPEVMTWSPYDAGWLVDIATEAMLSPKNGFIADESVAERWFESEAERVDSFARTDNERLGPTLGDGGVARGTLREVLGPAGFRAAIRGFSNYLAKRK